MKQFLLTPSAGKRLIGKALSQHHEILKRLNKGIIAIIAGTTNGYIAQEIFSSIGEKRSFNRQRFFRGINLPPNYKMNHSGRLADESGFTGDVIIQNGSWLKGHTIFDIIDKMEEDDIVIKGANALDMEHRRAAVMIGSNNGGTIIPIIQSAFVHRIRIIIPVGLEKRISGDIDKMASEINSPGSSGFRLIPLPGDIFTEIDALYMLTGMKANLFAAGGISGAEGCVCLYAAGTPEQESVAESIVKSISAEPPFIL
jgi:hypothetical protein